MLYQGPVTSGGGQTDGGLQESGGKIKSIADIRCSTGRAERLNSGGNSNQPLIIEFGERINQPLRIKVIFFFELSTNNIVSFRSG